MRKTGMIAGLGFLAGAIFFALVFGFHGVPSASVDVVPGADSGSGFSAGFPTVEAEGVKVRTNGMNMNFVELVKKVRPAVVKVVAESIVERGPGFGNDLLERFFKFQRRRERVPGVGSGFFISADGYLITNNHVVKDAIKVKIKTIDDTEYSARIVGTDPRTDLALLKIDADKLPYVELGNSNSVEVGEWVLAIGNPLNQDLSVTAGIISAKGRQLGLADYEDFLQTDAAINRGNSGGPLLNMEGKVIGINSAIIGPGGGNVGIGFAIPANMAAKVVKDLKTEGRVVRGYLGVRIEWLKEKEAKEFDLPVAGVLLVRVDSGSPAQKAGLKKYDLITEVNGKRLRSATDLSISIADTSPGDTVKLTVYRGKEKKTIKAEVGEAQESMKYTAGGEEGRAYDLGMVLVKNSRALADQYDLETDAGILVREVKRGSPAYENRIRTLDVILEANGRELNSVEQFRDLISSKKPGSLVLLYVKRGKDEGMVRFRLPE